MGGKIDLKYQVKFVQHCLPHLQRLFFSICRTITQYSVSVRAFTPEKQLN
jgi:hypothetical protein